MPKSLFYTGTAFCLFIALSCLGAAMQQVQSGNSAFIALYRDGVSRAAGAAVGVALVAGLSSGALFLRMAALVAARNLFSAFLTIVSVGCSVVSLAWVLLLQARMAVPAGRSSLGEMHLAGLLMLGGFVSLSLIALRPYFRIQASRVLAAMVLFPLPIFALILVQELFFAPSAPPLPAATPASTAFVAVLAIVFFSTAIHCIRHRYLFIEATNLRELLDSRVDPAHPAGKPIRLSGGVAFDS